MAAACALCLLLGLTPNAARAEDAGSRDDADHTRIAFELGLNGIAPFSGYADRQIGGGFEAGMGIVIDRALLLAVLGVRHAVANEINTFTHVPIETSLAYLLSSGDNTPFIGGGLLFSYLYEHVFVERTVGMVLRSTSRDVIDDEEYGAGLIARAGVLFWRSQTLSFLIGIDYMVTFADFQERSSEHALRLNLQGLIGGR